MQKPLKPDDVKMLAQHCDAAKGRKGEHKILKLARTDIIRGLERDEFFASLPAESCNARQKS